MKRAMRRVVRSHREKGFNLMELIIVVSIIGILASIVYPMYTQYMLETRRSDGWIALTTAEAAQLQWYSINFNYTADISHLGGAESPEGFYDVSVGVDNDDGTFMLTATAKANGLQVNDTGCTVLTLNHTGIKTPDECW